MQNTFGKRMKRLLVGLLVLVFAGAFLYFENNALTSSEYTVTSDKLSPDFDDFVIVQISDLHNKLFGADQERLIQKIKQENPDIIVITGDLIDSNHPEVEKGLLFTERAREIAPVYFITGNHDNGLSDTDTFRLYDGLCRQGIKVLRDESVALFSDGSWQSAQAVSPAQDNCIYLMGVDDDTLAYKSKLGETLDKLLEEKEETLAASFSVLLAHEPQLFGEYAKKDINLVLCGHAHGGQIRIPFIGGFVAPDQGFLPQYTEGMHEENHTAMIVSRGLGNSVVPIRLLNRPELVKITLKYEP